MTTQRKLLYGAGILLLLLFHVVIAFALGVYVGRYGLTREGLTLQGPGNVERPPAGAAPDRPGTGQPEPEGPAVPALPGEPAVLGRIRRVGREMLDLATREGPRQVMVDAGTRVRDSTGAILNLEDLSPGQIVAVFGVRIDGGQGLQADLIVILPQGEPAGN
jgi:hypothetical protein